MIRLTLFISLLFVASSSTLPDLARFWIVTCKINSCEKAFQNAIDNKCSGLKQCKAVIDQHYPYCSMCFDDLVDKEILEEINGQEYLVCSSEELVQSIGCELYCRVNWFVTGHCGRLGNVPVCQCSNSLRAPSTGSWTIKHTLSGHSNGINSLVTLPNDDIVSCSFDKTAKLWDTFTGLLKKTLSGHTAPVYALSVFPNGDLAS